MKLAPRKREYLFQLRAMDLLGHCTIALTATHLVPSMPQDMSDKMDTVLGR